MARAGCRLSALKFVPACGNADRIGIIGSSVIGLVGSGVEVGPIGNCWMLNFRSGVELPPDTTVLNSAKDSLRAGLVFEGDESGAPGAHASLL